MSLSSPRLFVAFGMAMSLLTLSGCSLGMSVESGSLAGACQFQPCECVGSGGALGFGGERASIVWRENGDATCPDGFRLRLAAK